MRNLVFVVLMSVSSVTVAQKVATYTVEKKADPKIKVASVQIILTVADMNASPLLGASVKVTSGAKTLYTRATNARGRVVFNLPYGGSFLVEFTGKGFAKNLLVISTVVPEEQLSEPSMYSLEVMMKNLITEDGKTNDAVKAKRKIMFIPARGYFTVAKND